MVAAVVLGGMKEELQVETVLVVDQVVGVVAAEADLEQEKVAAPEAVAVMVDQVAVVGAALWNTVLFLNVQVA